MTGFSSEIQSVCPGVQLSTQHGVWIPVDTKDNRRCSTLYQPVFGVPGRRHLYSSRRVVVANCTFHVSISHLWLSTGDGRLPTPVSHLGTLYLTVSTLQTFKRHLKTFLFSTYRVLAHSARLRFQPYSVPTPRSCPTSRHFPNDKYLFFAGKLCCLVK